MHERVDPRESSRSIIFLRTSHHMRWLFPPCSSYFESGFGIICCQTDTGGCWFTQRLSSKRSEGRPWAHLKEELSYPIPHSDSKQDSSLLCWFSRQMKVILSSNFKGRNNQWDILRRKEDSFALEIASRSQRENVLGLSQKWTLFLKWGGHEETPCTPACEKAKCVPLTPSVVEAGRSVQTLGIISSVFHPLSFVHPRLGEAWTMK